MIWQITSGVNVAGAPHRGASLRRAATPAEPSASRHRRRQCPDVLQRAQEHPRLLAGAGAQLDQGVGLREFGDGQRVLLEEVALGRGAGV